MTPDKTPKIGQTVIDACDEALEALKQARCNHVQADPVALVMQIFRRKLNVPENSEKPQ